MHRLLRALFATVLLLATGASTVLADGMLLPVPDAVAPGYLAVRYHHVAVSIDDGHAVTQVEQAFYNPYDVPISGQYLFPIPPDAVLSGFRATVDGRPQEMIRQDVVRTNDQLRGNVVLQHDPTLLQYAGWESLAFMLDLQPGQTRTMSLTYEEVLAPHGGLLRYRYVLSTERYSSLPLEKVSVRVDLRASSGLASLYSPNHAVSIERLDSGRARVSWEAAGTNPSEDFELFFTPADGGYGGGLLTGARDDQDHFLFLFSPDLEPRTTAYLPKDMVFVIDRSGSMSGEKIEQARDALQFILGQLGEQDRFSIVSFDDRIATFDRSLVAVDADAIRDARRFVERLSAGGSTDLEQALQTGLKILERSENRGASRMLVFLTDGLPTAGITDEGVIASLVAGRNARLEARLHVFGVGYDVNTHLLDGLASDNGGSVSYVQPGENLELALTGFYAKIAHPLLTDIEVDFEGMAVQDLYPQTLPDLFQGSGLLLAGRFHAEGDEATVRVRGRAGEEIQEYVYRFDLAETAGRDFVPRLWATRRVGALLDRVRVDGESPALAEEIRGLGLRYGIVTPYTTWAIEGQRTGAASAENLALYGRSDLNDVSGQTTIQARVQNQMYQEAAQANLAAGANVSSYGSRSLAQVGGQQVDLTLLVPHADLDGGLTAEWIADNIDPDRTVEFGSEEYWALAAEPDLLPFLQSGSNVVFAYKGEVIAIWDSGAPAPAQAGALLAPPQAPSDGLGISHAGAPDLGILLQAPTSAGRMPLLVVLALVGAAVLMLGSVATLVTAVILARQVRRDTEVGT